jgi:hypothetical protein
MLKSGRQCFHSKQDSSRNNFVICWQLKEHWKAISKTLLQETDKKFREAVGQFELVEVLEYEVL